MEQNKCCTQNFWLILKFTRTMGATEVYVIAQEKCQYCEQFLDKMDSGHWTGWTEIKTCVSVYFYSQCNGAVIVYEMKLITESQKKIIDSKHEWIKNGITDACSTADCCPLLTTCPRWCPRHAPDMPQMMFQTCPDDAPRGLYLSQKPNF